MAAHLKEHLGIETTLVRGNSGEFTVWVGDARVVEKIGQAFPTPEECELAVAKALQG